MSHVVPDASRSVLAGAEPFASDRVARLDNDAPAIFAGAVDFIKKHPQTERPVIGQPDNECSVRDPGYKD
jgi:hypothetical protein